MSQAQASGATSEMLTATIGQHLDSVVARNVICRPAEDDEYEHGMRTFFKASNLDAPG